MKILISGYYGFGNAGDELILETIISELLSQRKDSEITVMSATPKETAKTQHVKAVNRWNIFKVFNEIRMCDILISGGGGLFQDITGSAGLYYYLGIIMLAKVIGKKVFIYAAGVNDLKRINKTLLILVFKLVDGITVRESDSYNLLVNWGLQKEKIIITADPVMLKVVNNSKAPNTKPNVVFILRPPQKGKWPVELFAKLADSLHQRLNSNTIFIPFHQKNDTEFSLAVMRSMNVKPTLMQWKDFNDIYDTVGSADLIISQRLHGLILALLYGVPVMGISDDPKIDRFLKELGQKNISILTEENFYLVLAVILDMWEWREEFKRHAKKILPNFRVRAKKNSELPFLTVN